MNTINKLIQFAERVRPAILDRSGPQQFSAALTVLMTLWALPFVAITVFWLIFATEWVLFVEHSFEFILLLVLILLFVPYTYTIQMEVIKGVYTSTAGAFDSLIVWSAALLFGPTALWLPLIVTVGRLGYEFWQTTNADLRWQSASRHLGSIGSLFSALIGLVIYQWLGGTLPLADLTAAYVWPALAATAVSLIVILPLGLPSVWLSAIMIEQQAGALANRGHIARLFLTAVGLSALVSPFAILAAGLYSQHGLANYLFMIAGAFLASLLANRLSTAVQQSNQRSRELATLEAFGRALIDADPQTIDLPTLLGTHLTGFFPQTSLEIWLEPDTLLFRQNPDMPFPDRTQSYQRLLSARQTSPQLSHLMLGEITPADAPQSSNWQGACVSIQDDSYKLLGVIYLRVLTENRIRPSDYLPATQSLAAQISSVLHRIELHHQTIAHERMTRELEVAGRIQATFLPNTIPELPGWDITAALKPARQTSGDFYDFVPLDNGRLAIIIADVADKGTGAALYMALSRTLLRTHAIQYPNQPQKVLQETNKRILTDTESDQFVTVFYGVLDPHSGQLRYANAGHNPPYLFNGQEKPISLTKTGAPLGMFDHLRWQQQTHTLKSNDLLVLYTDGVTEAQDNAFAEFGDERFIDLMQGRTSKNINELQENLLQEITAFTGDAPQFDDITLVMITRQAKP